MNCDRIIMTHLFPKTQQFEEKQDFLVSFKVIAKPVSRDVSIRLIQIGQCHKSLTVSNYEGQKGQIFKKCCKLSERMQNKNLLLNPSVNDVLYTCSLLYFFHV